MIKNTSKLVATGIICFCVSAEAADMRKALSKPISKSWMTGQSLDEAERCIIMSDGPALAHVFKQADRPDNVMLAYSIGVGVPLLVELTRKSSGVQIDVRTSGTGIKKIPKDFDGCI